MEKKPTISSSFVKPIYKPDIKVDRGKHEEATAFTHDIFVEDEEIEENDDSK